MHRDANVSKPFGSICVKVLFEDRASYERCLRKTRATNYGLVLTRLLIQINSIAKVDSEAHKLLHLCWSERCSSRRDTHAYTSNHARNAQHQHLRQVRRDQSPYLSHSSFRVTVNPVTFCYMSYLLLKMHT